HTRFDCDWSSDVRSSDLRLELRYVEARVKDGPQHVVRVAEVVVFVLATAKRERRDRRPADLGDVGLGALLLALLADLAVPAEPQPTALAEHIGDGDHHAAGLPGLVEVSDAV